MEEAKGKLHAISIFDQDSMALVILVAVAIILTLGTYLVLSQSIDLYFPADAAEYVADARALLGDGVREVRHAPLFPVLVALFLGVEGPVAAVQLSMALALFLLPVSLYLLLRQWMPNLPSLVGASVAALTPMSADLIGWSGGATLIGLDMMVFCLAFMEAWLREQGKQGLIVGIFAGFALIAHPFMAAGLLLVLAVRWIWFMAQRRKFSTDWSPLGVRGLLSFLLPAFVLFASASEYYLNLRGTSAYVSPDFLRPWLVLWWGTRANPAVLFSILLAVLLPVPLARPVFLFITLPILAISLTIPLLLAWDITYSLRVVYFLPIVVAIGIALVSQLTLESVQDRIASGRITSIVAAVLLVVAPIGAVYVFGYVEWTRADSTYYQRVHSADFPAFDYLRSGQGTVAVSWNQGFYDEGKVNAWFVEGLSNRPAIGPGAPWTWTLANVGESEIDLQRYFSGALGIEDGAIQASASATGHLADPAIQVGVGGFYYPLAYLNSVSNTYPISITSGSIPTVRNDTIEFSQSGSGSNGTVVETVRLNQSRLVISYELLGAVPARGDWEVWIWPTYWINWDVLDVTPSVITTMVTYREGSVAARYIALDSDATLQYLESHPVWGVQAIKLQRANASSVSLEVNVEGTDPVRDLARFDERDILGRYNITTVLVWIDTGWEFRFEGVPCYSRAYETANLVAYQVSSSCL